MFERQSMEQLLNKMIRWTRGVSNRFTDFRVGSKIRTLYEAVALIVEELYDKVYRSMKSVIEDNIYSVIGFNKIPATYASGNAVMSRTEPAVENYLIPAGTVVLSKATQYKPPIQYRTIADALLEVGRTTVTVAIVSSVSGVDGNVGAGEIASFLMQPNGIEAVTNTTAVMGGNAEETKEEQKARFQVFIEANARGILQSVRYGAMLAQIEAVDGVVLERVKQAVAIENLPARKGEVDVYIWNGTGNASEALKAEVQKILTGYYDTEGNAVYGYKPAGIISNVYTAPVQSVKLRVIITPETWSTVAETQPSAEQIVDNYFGNIKLGETFIQTALEAEIKRIEGIKDIKLYVSTDGGTIYSMDNVVVSAPTIVVPTKPLLYV